MTGLATAHDDLAEGRDLHIRLRQVGARTSYEADQHAERVANARSGKRPVTRPLAPPTELAHHEPVLNRAPFRHPLPSRRHSGTQLPSHYPEVAYDQA